MNAVLRVLRQLGVDRSGATAIEYAFLAALIAMAIVVSLRAIGGELGNTFVDVRAGLSAPAATSP